MAIQVKYELDAGDRRTITIPMFVWQNDLVTPLTYPDAEGAMLTQAATDFGANPRMWTFRRLSAHSYRFYLEYSLHTFKQDSATPDNEVLEFPRLYLPEARELLRPVSRIGGSESASPSAPEGKLLIPSEEELPDSEKTKVRVEPPKQNTSFVVDIPTADKYYAFLSAIKKCHGKLNDAEFQGHPAGCVMILTAAPISPPGEIPRIEVGAAVGEPSDLSHDGEEMEDVLPFSWIGFEYDGEAYGVVMPLDEAIADPDKTVHAMHEVAVFESADYSDMELPEPA